MAKLNVIRENNGIVVAVKEKHFNDVSLSFNPNPGLAPRLNAELLFKGRSLGLAVFEFALGLESGGYIGALQLERKRLYNLDVSFGGIVAKALVEHFDLCSAWRLQRLEQSVFPDCSKLLRTRKKAPVILLVRNGDIIELNSLVLCHCDMHEFESKLGSGQDKQGLASHLWICRLDYKGLNNCEFDAGFGDVFVTWLEDLYRNCAETRFESPEKEVVIVDRINFPVHFIVASFFGRDPHEVFMAFESSPVKFEALEVVEDVAFVIKASDLHLVVVALVDLSEPGEYLKSVNVCILDLCSHGLVCS